MDLIESWAVALHRLQLRRRCEENGERRGFQSGGEAACFANAPGGRVPPWTLFGLAKLRFDA